MSEEVTAATPTEPEGSTDVPTTPEPEQPVTAPSERVEDLPEFAQKMIRDLRQEAASYRQRAKTAAEEAETTLKSEFNTQLQTVNNEKAELETRANGATSDLARLKAALATGVRPDLAEEFAARLHGNSEDELRADADRLKSVFGITERRGDPSQGATGKNTSGDPFADFIASMRK